MKTEEKADERTREIASIQEEVRTAVAGIRKYRSDKKAGLRHNPYFGPVKASFTAEEEAAMEQERASIQQEAEEALEVMKQWRKENPLDLPQHPPRN